MSSLSNQLQSVADELQALIPTLQNLESQSEDWQQRVKAVEDVLGEIDAMSLVPQIEKAAADAGVPVKEWIAEVLLEACQPDTRIPIDPGIYERIKGIANGRSISIRELCTGVDFTEIFRIMIVNRHI